MLSPQQDRQWQEALKRRQIIEPIADLSVISTQLVEKAAKQLSLSPRRVWSLIQSFRADPRTSSLLPGQRGQHTGTQRLDNARETLINEVIESYHATRQKPRKSDSYEELQRRCNQRGLQPPHYKTFARRLKVYDPKRLLKAREGAKRARDRLGAIPDHFEAQRPLEIMQIDHTLADVFVVDRVRREALGRPCLTLAMDVYSRVVLGFHIAFEAPSVTSVAMCITHACTDKYAWLSEHGVEVSWPFAGRPESIHLDNAPEFQSEALRHGCNEHGIIINYRPVKTPHFGGHIERLIGTMMGKVHLLPGSTFSNVIEKGDYDAEANAVLTLPEFEQWFALEIARYHDKVHSALDTTPRAMWQSGIEARGEPPSVSDPIRFGLDFMPYTYRKLHRDGIHLHGLRYWSDTFGLWLGRITEKCQVRYDPRDLSCIWVRLPSGDDLAAHYADLRWPPLTLWELRAAHRALRAQGLAATDPAAVFRAAEQQRTIVEDARHASRKARRFAAKQDEARRAATTSSLSRSKTKPEAVEDDGVDYSKIPPPYDVEIWD